MNYSEEEFNNIFNEIYEELKKNKEKEEKTIAYILGGQPGAGKSKLTYMLYEKFDGNVITINGDEYRKEHPRFKELQEIYKDDYVLHTQEFASEITNKLIEKLSDEKYNLIIEGTLRTKEVPINTLKLLKNKGYDEVNLCLVQVRPEISFLGTLIRYENMKQIGTIPRSTSKDHHDLVVNKIIENLDYIYKLKVFDNIEIYNRENENLYNFKNQKNINPSDLFKNEFSRPLLNSEKIFLENGYKEILGNMVKRNESREEINKIESFMNEALNKERFNDSWRVIKKNDLER